MYSRLLKIWSVCGGNRKGIQAQISRCKALQSVSSCMSKYENTKEYDQLRFYEKRLNKKLTSTDYNTESHEDFGSLSESSKPVIFHEDLAQVNDVKQNLEDLEQEEEPIKGVDFHRRLNKDGKYHPSTWYYGKAKKMIADDHLEEALEFLFQRMLEKDRILPTRHFFHLLLDGCIKRGDSKTAFVLYKKMSDLRIQANQLTYSRLFKVCAEEISRINKEHRMQTPMLKAGQSIDEKRAWKKIFSTQEELIKDPYKRALSLWDKLRYLNIPLSMVSCNALLTSLGQAGDIRGCLRAIDEWLQHGLAGRKTPFTLDKPPNFDEGSEDPTPVAEDSQFRPDYITFNCCLSALCNSRKSSASNEDLLLFLRLWHTLLPIMKGKLRASTFTTIAALLSSSASSPPKPGGKLTIHKIPESFNKMTFKSDVMVPEKLVTSVALSQPLDLTQFDLKTQEHALASPVNLLQLQNSASISVNLPQTALSSSLQPWQKLALFGGLKGFLSMVPFPKKPAKENLQLFNKLVRLLPPIVEEKWADTFDPFEEEILRQIHQLKLQPDLILLNQFLYRRSSSNQPSLVILKFMKKRKIKPDAFSWSCIARGCRSREEMEQLFELRQSFTRETPPLQMFTSLFYSFKPKLHLSHATYILQKMLDFGVKPDKRLIFDLEVLLNRKRKSLDASQLVKPDNSKREYFLREFTEFKRIYQRLLDSIK